MEREILKRLADLSAQVARLKGTYFPREPGTLGLGTGEPVAGTSLYTSNEHGSDYLPSDLLYRGHPDPITSESVAKNALRGRALRKFSVPRKGGSRRSRGRSHRRRSYRK